MKPLIHAKNSVKKYGGKIDDYLNVHSWFDQTKSHVPEMKHRIFLHNSFGIFLCEQQFGVYITNSDNSKVDVRSLGEDHVIEDLGFIPTLDECCKLIQNADWLYGSRHKDTIMKKIILTRKDD